MQEDLRTWLSDVGPYKSSVFRGMLATPHGESAVEFDSNTLEFKVDGRSMSVAGALPNPRAASAKSAVKPDSPAAVTTDVFPIVGQFHGAPGPALEEPLAKFFVHVNNFCNLRCTYCYEEDLPYDQIREAQLPDGRVDEVCRFIQRSSQGADKVQITFFGGEPFLTFSKVVRFYDHLEKMLQGQAIAANIVTNGTILKDDQLAFLKEKNFEVMVSFDGLREYQETQRPSADGEANYDLIVANIRRLVEAGVKKVSIRITYGQNSLDLLSSVRAIAELGVTDVAFRPVMDGTPVDRWPSPEEHSGNLRNVADYYMDRLVEQKPVIVNNVHEIVRRIVYQVPKTDYCNWGRTCSITPDGDIFPCTHFVGMPEFHMGNTRETSISRPVQERLLAATHMENLPCDSCSIKYLCGGGCRGCSQYVHSDIFREDDYCEARREMVFAVLNRMTSLWQDGRWQQSSSFIHDLMAEGGKKHSCDRFS